MNTHNESSAVGDNVSPSTVTELSLAYIEQLVQGGHHPHLVDYCGTLPYLMRDKVRKLVDDDKLMAKVSFKGEPIDLKVRADLSAWGYDDIRMNVLDDSIYVGGEKLSDGLEAVIKSNAYASEYGMSRSKPMGAVMNEVTSIAKSREYHPVIDYLDGLEWDGEDHVGRLASYFTDKHEPIQYEDGSTRSVFHAFLDRWGTSAVGKARHGDGVEVQNTALVLAGGQGLGKSFLASWICPPSLRAYKVSSSIKPDNEDHHRLAAIKFIWEVAELGATTRRADVEALKDFITKIDVSFRVPYAKHGVDKPVLANFIGTVNPSSGFLNDPTGSRRFSIVELTSVDRGYSTQVDVDQLWAQWNSQYLADPSQCVHNEAEDTVRYSINEEHEVDPTYRDQLLDIYNMTGNQGDVVMRADIELALKRKHEVGAVNRNALTNTLLGMGCTSKRLSKGTAWVGLKESM